MKVFESGVIVGRFQHIHIGHEKLINIGLSLCNKLLVFIGSSNESETKRNPYDVNYRKKLISTIYSDEVESGKIIIKPLPDFKDSTKLSPEWGKYVLSEAEDILNNIPSCIIYGKDKDIFKCFDKKTVENLTEIYVDRKSMQISATKMREFLINDNEFEWRKYANSKIHSEYSNLREILNNIYKSNND